MIFLVVMGSLYSIPHKYKEIRVKKIQKKPSKTKSNRPKTCQNQLPAKIAVLRAQRRSTNLAQPRPRVELLSTRPKICPRQNFLLAPRKTPHPAPPRPVQYSAARTQPSAWCPMLSISQIFIPYNDLFQSLYFNNNEDRLSNYYVIEVYP